MTQTQVWTIGRLLEWTTDFLRQRGSESPRLEAEVLLAHARGAPRIQLYTAFNDEPTEIERTAFREMVRRRGDGTPVAYLVGHKEFYSLDFFVNPDCLIPRPETEHLVVTALDWLKKQRTIPPPVAEVAETSGDRRPIIADIGTGSGCIAIAVAKHFPECQMIATDISREALATASKNVVKHDLQTQIQLHQGDLLTAIPEDSKPLDMILSNPPYVTEEEYQKLPKEVREHEPKAALLSGLCGMEITERLFESALQTLRVGGVAIVESSPMLMPKIEAFLQGKDEWSIRSVMKDLQGHARIIMAERIR